MYAGSGAVGLEALSRGARSALFVESDRRSVRIIQKNVRELGFGGVADVVAEPVERVVSRRISGPPYGFVFADPPYAFQHDAIARVFTLLKQNGWVAEDGLVAVERSRRAALEWPEGFEELRNRRYGDTTLWYGRPARRDTLNDRS